MLSLPRLGVRSGSGRSIAAVAPRREEGTNQPTVKYENDTLDTDASNDDDDDDDDDGCGGGVARRNMQRVVSACNWLFCSLQLAELFESRLDNK